MWWIQGRCSTRIPLHHQFCPTFCVLMNFWQIVGSRSPFQGITRNLRTRRILCAGNWWLVHHQSKTNTSMKSVPSWLCSFHRSRLIVRLSISQICRTSVSLWHLLYFWWNANCLSNSSPWVQMLAMLKTWTFTITECLSLSFVAYFEDWFCLFHTWSFRMIWSLTTILILLRCKNSSYRFHITSLNLSVCCPVLLSINSSDFHSWEDKVSFHSEWLDERAHTTGRPVESYFSVRGLKKWLIFVFGFPRTFCWCSELFFGVNVPYLDFGVQIDSIELPTKSNSVGSGNMSHCRPSPLHDHLDHCFVVFEHTQKSFLMRRLDVWGNKINIIIPLIDCSLRLLAFVNRVRWATKFTFVL